MTKKAIASWQKLVKNKEMLLKGSYFSRIQDKTVSETQALLKTLVDSIEWSSNKYNNVDDDRKGQNLKMGSMLSIMAKHL